MYVDTSSNYIRYFCLQHLCTYASYLVRLYIYMFLTQFRTFCLLIQLLGQYLGQGPNIAVGDCVDVCGSCRHQGWCRVCSLGQHLRSCWYLRVRVEPGPYNGFFQQILILSFFREHCLEGTSSCQNVKGCLKDPLVLLCQCW